jgi:hypothetical protein
MGKTSAKALCYLKEALLLLFGFLRYIRCAVCAAY